MRQHIRPNYFTAFEGDFWVRFPQDFKFCMSDLEFRSSHQIVLLSLDGEHRLSVHSLCFGEWWQHHHRWDCLSGWTT